MHHRFFLVLLLVCAPWTVMGQYTSLVWSPDRGDGTYQNPVLYADYSEPFALRQGKWIGAKYGFVAESESPCTSRGWLDVDWIHLERPAAPNHAKRKQ